MPDETPSFLDAREFAERVDLHRQTVYEMLRAGEVPGARKIGGSWRIPEWALQEVGTPSHLATV